MCSENTFFHKALGLGDFNASSGWPIGLKQSYEIRQLNVERQCLNANVTAAESFCVRV